MEGEGEGEGLDPASEGVAGSVAARTAQVAVRERSTRQAVSSQGRNAVLNIVK